MILTKVVDEENVQARILETLNITCQCIGGENTPILSLKNEKILVDGSNGPRINQEVLNEWEDNICNTGYSYAFHTLRPTIFLRAKKEEQKKINFLTRLVVLRSVAICVNSTPIRIAIKNYLSQFEIPEFVRQVRKKTVPEDLELKAPLPTWWVGVGKFLLSLLLGSGALIFYTMYFE